MTPERVQEFADAVFDKTIVNLERAITLAVNEALSEAVRRCAVESAKYDSHTVEAAACRGALSYAEDAIRALKLPEGR